MGRDRIDDISGIDLATVKLSELRWRVGTGVSVLLSGTGRDKKYGYRHGVLCELGDIREDIWYQAVELVALRDGEQQFVDDLTTWRREHNYVKDSATKLRQDALELYACRIYDNPQWVSYVPFNRRFRPEALIHARLVTVTTACCNTPDEVAQEQIDHAWQHRLSCPHCGRWSEFTVIESANDPPWEPFM